MNRIKFASVCAGGLAIATSASARDIWHGWMNLTPCSKVEWRNDGIFGTPSPTVKTGPQELHGYISVDAPDSIEAALKDCANKGVQAAGVAAVLTNWAAAFPAFSGTFKACLGGAAAGVTNINFRTSTQCKY